MNKIKKIDLNKLYIVTDFDHTLTTKESQNCWGILSKIPNVSKEYIYQSNLNNNYYFPIEQDETLNYQTKNKLMKEWYQKHTNLLVKYKLKEKDINEIGQSSEIILRKNVVDFFKLTNKKNIPVIIISAGISNIIENVLNKNKCFFNNIYIIANIIKFKNGIVSSLRNEIIHSLNKNQIKPPYKIKKILENKNEMILIGDNIGDTLMKIKENDKTLKIGILNYNDKKKYHYFKQNFDIVYKENSFDQINKLIEKITL